MWGGPENATAGGGDHTLRGSGEFWETFRVQFAVTFKPSLSKVLNLHCHIKYINATYDQSLYLRVCLHRPLTIIFCQQLGWRGGGSSPLGPLFLRPCKVCITEPVSIKTVDEGRNTRCIIDKQYKPSVVDRCLIVRVSTDTRKICCWCYFRELIVGRQLRYFVNLLLVDRWSWKCWRGGVRAR